VRAAKILANGVIAELILARGNLSVSGTNHASWITKRNPLISRTVIAPIANFLRIIPAVDMPVSSLAPQEQREIPGPPAATRRRGLSGTKLVASAWEHAETQSNVKNIRRLRK